MESPLKAFNADQWVNCNGSVLMQTLLPETDSAPTEAKLEGRAFHWLIEQIIKSYQKEGPILSAIEFVDSFDKAGTLITLEMCDSADEVINDVLEYCQQHGTLQDVKVEHRVDMSFAFPGMYGYVDIHIHNKKQREIVTWEAKYGHGYVAEYENWQSIGYASALLEEFGIDGLQDQHYRLSLRVAQPRCFQASGSVRAWNLVAADLRPYTNKYISAAYDALSGNPATRTGTWCKNCSGTSGCQTLQHNIYSHIDRIGEVVVNALTGDSLGTEIILLQRAQKLIEMRLAGLETQALSELRTGASVAGFGAEMGYGRKRFKKEIDVNEIIMLGELLGVDLRKPVELVTPAQAVKKGVDESVIAAYSETPSTGYKLKQDNGVAARLAFSRGNK